MENCTVAPRLEWVTHFFLSTTILTLPLYFLIQTTLIWKRIQKQKGFDSVFYKIILSQGIADCSAALVYLFLTIFRRLFIALPFFFEHAAMLAPMGYVSRDYFIALRCYGSTIFAVHRMLTVVFDGRKFEQMVSNLNLMTIMIIHWVPPFHIILISLLQKREVKFNMGDCLKTVLIDEAIEEVYTLMLCIWVVVTFLLALMADSYLIIFVSRSKSSGGKSREHRVLIVLIGQLICSSIVFFYYVVQWLTFFDIYGPPFLYVLFPAVYAIESYYNPWLYIALNKQLREEVLRFLRIKRAPKQVGLTVTM